MDDKVKTIPYATLELATEKMFGIIKKLIVVIIILIIALIGTNIAWIVYENQFEDIVQTVEQDAENGTNNFIGGDVYGEAESNH